MKALLLAVVISVLALPVWGAYEAYRYIESLPSQWHQDRIDRTVKSATTALKYIQAGEKSIGCIELKFAYLRLVELGAIEASEIGKGYDQICKNG